MITHQQIRAVLADGGRVLDATGRPVGRIEDVVLGVQGSQSAWVALDCELCSGVRVLVPLARARLLGACLQLPYTADQICGAPRTDATAGRLDGRREEQLRRYYAVLDDAPPVWPHLSPEQVPIVMTGALPVGWGTPVAAPNGHRRLNGASHASHPRDPSPGVLSDIPGLDVLCLPRGLDVRTGDDSPAAYPATPSGPWPPVSTFSPGPPWWQRRQWRWPSVLASLRIMRLEVRPVLDMTGLPEDEIEDLLLAAGEAAANAVEHARFPTPPVFDVLADVGDACARIVIQDHGRWRAPTAGGDRGRGLQMIGVLVDATLTVGPRGTTVVLCNRAGSCH